MHFASINITTNLQTFKNLRLKFSSREKILMFTKVLFPDNLISMLYTLSCSNLAISHKIVLIYPFIIQKPSSVVSHVSFPSTVNFVPFGIFRIHPSIYLYLTYSLL
jgi:hypothetical protein